MRPGNRIITQIAMASLLFALVTGCETLGLPNLMSSGEPLTVPEQIQAVKKFVTASAREIRADVDGGLMSPDEAQPYVDELAKLGAQAKEAYNLLAVNPSAAGLIIAGANRSMLALRQRIAAEKARQAQKQTGGP